MAIYETVVVEVPTAREEEKGAIERIICGPCILSAVNEEQARVQTLLTHTLPSDVVKRRVEVLVRLFTDAS